MSKTVWKIDNIFKADAQKCANEINTLGDDIRADKVLDLARNKKTELHKCFEWDDTVAAEKYRLHQAHRVIRMLVVQEDAPAEERPPIRLFYKAATDKGYRPVDLIVKREDEYKALLARAYAELRAFKEKYSMLTELQEIFELIY